MVSNSTARALRRPRCAPVLAPLAALALVCMASGCRVPSQFQNTGGVKLYQQGQYAAAIQKFQQAVATDPNNPDGYYNLASAYQRMGTLYGRKEDLDQAERYYNLCLDHDPNHVDCYRGLAVLLAQEGRNEQAFRLLEGWAQRSPTSAAPRVELARLSEEFGDPNLARDHLLAALQADPYDSRALAALGNVYDQQGNQAQALAVYQRSLTRNPFQPQVAARVASLRSSYGLNTTPTTPTPPGGTRTVSVPQPTPTQPPRY